ncbi:MAG: TRAP transporter small permease [Alphaproteobacteria bacterium]|nr:TRAP transporter small permease [Alphaproteobacteria bacterium]
MRKILDSIYHASGVLAATCLVAICTIVIAQVAGRVIDRLATVLTGDQIGLVVPSAAEFSGFFLAGASFLALAYTMRHGGHIRVSLLVQTISGEPRRLIELWCLAFGAATVAFFAWHAILLVLDSYEFEEVSYGIIAVPLWIPQSAMALGLVVLAIALFDDLVRVATGREPSYEGKEEALLSGEDEALFAE